MKLWRISKNEYAETAFDGLGAKKVGGRWNNPGVPLVYTSEHLSLAALELLVHVAAEDDPPDLVAVWAELDDSVDLPRLTVDEMPQGWQRVTGHARLKEYGDRWQRAKSSLALAVPSVVVPEELNILVNPEHPDFTAKVKFGGSRPFSFDSRLFAR